jgi:hypothetical protein
MVNSFALDDGESRELWNAAARTWDDPVMVMFDVTLDLTF